MSFDINSLPISKNLTEISVLLSKEPYLVLKAEPGAGKSTAVPLYLLKHLDLGGKKIIMLEPRRLAARSIAEFLAAQLDERVGQTVGYQVRNERKVSAATQLEIVTEGILNTRIQADPELHDIGLIIFDEFHVLLIDNNSSNFCQIMFIDFLKNTKLLSLVYKQINWGVLVM